MPHFKPEMKVVDTVQSHNLAGYIGAGQCLQILNPVQIGPSYFQRLGRKISGVSLNLKVQIYLTYANAAAHPGGTVRVCIIYDKRPKATIAGYEVYQNVDQTGTLTEVIASPRNVQNQGRFVTLRDWFMELPAVGINGAAVFMEFPTPTVKELVREEYIPLKGKITEFIGTANPIVFGNFAAGSLFVYLNTTFGGSSDGYNLRITSRYKFTDV